MGAGVAKALGPHRAAFLKSHGTAVVGKTIEEAVIAAIMLENAAWHWADPETAPPALLIGYGSVREGDLARGIDCIGSLMEMAAGRNAAARWR